jgi:hypothetical protein
MNLFMKYVGLNMKMVDSLEDLKNFLGLDSKISIKKCHLKNLMKHFHIITTVIMNQDLNLVMLVFEI